MKKISLITLTILLAGFFINCESGQSQTSETETESQSEQPTYMLQHNVYFYLNDDVTEEQEAAFVEGLKRITAIESVYASELGVPAETAERDVTDHEFAYAIFSWFTSIEEYKIYDEHPVHLEFIEEFNGLWADVKVFDSEIITDYAID